MSWLNFQMSCEDLEKCERVVPIFSIIWQLTEEQLKQVDNNKCIKVNLLTKEQLTQVEEALRFDYHFAKIYGETASDIHRFL